MEAAEAEPSQASPAPAPPPEKKKLPRAPSPARPKDVPGWSLAKSRRSHPGAPASFCGKPGAGPGQRRPGGGSGGRPERKGKPPQAAGGRSCGKGAPGRAGAKSKGRCRGPAGEEPPAPSLTDSSSEGSDCSAAEEAKLPSLELGGSDPESPGSAPARLAAGPSPLPDEPSSSMASSRLPLSASLAFSDLTEELLDAGPEGLARELDELRSENDYLKDEMEELRAEMLEMRDVYMEEDVYQLQELRQQLDQASKTCRILQYRLRKAERRSLRVAQTGQVDGELIHSLEQDVKVAKDVSVRLHSELAVVEKKRARLEEENEDLRQRLVETELAKQVLQTEMDKLRENSLRKRGSRSLGKPEKKPSVQEDSADLKCQLHFAKEESALMCKKLTKLAKENDSMREELVKYRSLYGDLESSLSLEELADSPHSREAELKVHLKLVEEEANILSRRIVELEVENRGLRAEMDDARGHGDKELLGPDSRFAFAAASFGDSGESPGELRRHLQFVEEEAELLRRSLLELEEQNKVLVAELSKYRSEQDLDVALSEDSCSVVSEPSQEELATAKVQISELSGKVKKLQYENRVLLSNLQRCDLASCQSGRPALETDAEAGDSADCIPSPLWREAETEARGPGSGRSPDSSPSRLWRAKDWEALHGVRDQAALVSKAIDVLIADANGFASGLKLCLDRECVDLVLSEATGNSDGTSDSKLINAIFLRLRLLQQELSSFLRKVDHLGDPLSFLPGSGTQASHKERGSELQPPPARDPAFGLCFFSSRPFGSFSSTCPCMQQPDFRDGPEWEAPGSRPPDLYRSTSAMDADPRSYKPHRPEESDSYAAEIKELQLVLAEAHESLQGLQEQLAQERQLRKEELENFSQKICQLREEQQKALLRRDFELQSLGLQRRLEQKFWSQEKNLLVQESQQFRQNFLLLALKLKWFLRLWRQGKTLPSEGDGFLEVSSVKELYLLIEEEELAPPQQADNKMCAGDAWPPSAPSESAQALADMKGALKELCRELQEERRGADELQQQLAKAKAAWEMERTELKCHVAQLESKAGKGVPERALKREREEHQHLLAESYGAVMDLTKQLQISEKNWSQEKLELLSRFQTEQQQAEQQVKELQNKLNQLQKGAERWAVSHSPGEKQGGSWKEALNEKITDKETAAETEPKGAGLKRTKSVSSMSEFESLLDCSPYLPGKSSPALPEHAHGKKGAPATQLLPTGTTDPAGGHPKNGTYVPPEPCAPASLAKDTLGLASWASNLPGQSPAQKQMQRSYTAPDKTGIRIYYSPPVARRLEAPLLPSKEGKVMTEPGFLFTMAKPTELEGPGRSENTYSRWLCNFSKQHRDLLDSHSPDKAGPPAPFPASLHAFEITGNMSDDMKEITNCVRQAIRSGSLERKVKSASSQTAGLASVGTQTTQTVSVGLQTDAPRASLHSKSWSPRGSALMAVRSKQISSSLDKVHSRIERPCCSPKYGSPKLQRRSSSKLDSSKDRSLWNLHQSKQNGSAWARSTTTRDSPVLSNINDGLSSLFNVVEHSGSTESIWKPGCPESKAKAEGPKYGIVQEFFRNVCGRAQSPTSAPEKRDSLGDDGTKKQEHAQPATGHPSESIARSVPKKGPKQSSSEEPKGPALSQGSKDGAPRDPDIISAMASEDTACDCSSQSLTSCFARPSRSALRHSPSSCKLHPAEPSRAEEKAGPPSE